MELWTNDFSIFSPKGEGGKFIVSKNSNKAFFLDSCI